MAEEKKDTAEQKEKDGTVTVKGKKLKLVEPRGRNGRRATNFLLKFASGGDDETGVEEFVSLTENDEFLDVHLRSFLAEKDAEFADENATTGELLNLIMAVVENVFESFGTPEMDAALKNSPAAQEGEGE